MSFRGASLNFMARSEESGLNPRTLTNLVILSPMDEKHTGKRIVRPATAEESERYRAILEVEEAGMEANKALGREVLAERCELSAIVAELKAIREQLGVTLTELAERTGMTMSNLSRLENMDGPNPMIETLRRYAHAIGHRIEFGVRGSVL